MVGNLFRRAKAQLRTRPIYHSCDTAIRGHFFRSFLALVLQEELADRCAAAAIEWDDLIRDLDRPQEATIEKDGKPITTNLTQVIAPHTFLSRIVVPRPIATSAANHVMRGRAGTFSAAC